jgi:hypothetical protein
MKRPAKRQKDYEVTRDGWISIYPSLGDGKRRSGKSDLAAFLKGTIRAFASFIRGKEKSESFK